VPGSLEPSPGLRRAGDQILPHWTAKVKSYASVYLHSVAKSPRTRTEVQYFRPGGDFHTKRCEPVHLPRQHGINTPR